MMRNVIILLTALTSASAFGAASRIKCEYRFKQYKLTNNYNISEARYNLSQIEKSFLNEDIGVLSYFKGNINKEEFSQAIVQANIPESIINPGNAKDITFEFNQQDKTIEAYINGVSKVANIDKDGNASLSFRDSKQDMDTNTMHSHLYLNLYNFECTKL